MLLGLLLITQEHRQEMLKREEQQVHFAKELSDVSSIAGGESKLVFESTIKGLKNDAIYDGSNMNDLKERIKAVVKNELGIQRMNNDDVAVEIEVPIGVVDCSRCMPSSRTHSHQVTHPVVLPRKQAKLLVHPSFLTKGRNPSPSLPAFGRLVPIADTLRITARGG